MKNKLNKKGFTLVELLAVIVVLAIIMVIAFTSVSSAIQTARKNAFTSSVKMLQKEVKNRIVEAAINEATVDVECSTYADCAKKYDLSSNDYEMTVTKVDDTYTVRIEGIGRFKNISLNANEIQNAYTGGKVSSFNVNTGGSMTAASGGIKNSIDDILKTHSDCDDATSTQCNISFQVAGKTYKATKINSGIVTSTYN